MGGTTRKAPRLAEVAKLAGVSSGLVSRIINGDPTVRVRPETRERVLSAVEMLNYTPHMSARALRNAQTGLLGFALHHANDPIYVQLVDQAQAEAARNNFSLILLNTTELAERGDAFREIVLGRRVDGLLVQLGVTPEEGTLREIARNVPSVVFGADPAADLRTIRLDDVRAARLATEHLVQEGHTSIAYIGGDGASSQRRYEGYRSALAEAGLSPLAPINGGWVADSGHKAARMLLLDHPEVTGIVAVSTTTALGVHSGIIAAGLTIPGDVSLVSVHDTWFAPHLNPPLSVVALPLADVGRRAVAMLIEQIADPTTGETVVDEPGPKLVVRGSTGPPRTA